MMEATGTDKIVGPNVKSGVSKIDKVSGSFNMERGDAVTCTYVGDTNHVAVSRNGKAVGSFFFKI